jgi:hypothetical protein
MLDLVHLSEGAEETFINHDGHFLTPTAQARHLDLQLGHQPFRSTAAVVGSAVSGRKRQGSALVIPEHCELRTHARPRKIHCLNLQ